MSSDELHRILQSLDTELFHDEADRTKKLLSLADVSIEGPSKVVQVKHLRNYFERQSQKRGVPQNVNKQFAKLIGAADRFPNERWHQFNISRGSAAFLVFANEAGVGRACLDLTRTDSSEVEQTTERDKSKLKYTRVAWKHDHPEDPVMFYSELDEARWELRKIEVYRDGRVGYASDTEASPGSSLGEDAMPELEEIAKDSQFEPSEITREEFEAQWAARKRSP